MPSPVRTFVARLRPRLVLGGAVAIASIAALTVGILASLPTVPAAQAGLEILGAESVDASGIKLPVQGSRFANLTTAHPFSTPAGTGYAYLSRFPSGTRVCVAIPDGEGEGLYQGSCRPRAEAEARGISVSLVPDAPARATAVIVLPVGGTVVEYVSKLGAKKTYPSTNGVVAFEVPYDGRISWKGGSAGIQRDTVTRNFGYTPVTMRVTCGNGKAFDTKPLKIAGYKALCQGSRLTGVVVPNAKSGDMIQSVPDTSPP